MRQYNLTEESLFTLLSLAIQITQAFESIFNEEDILNSEFSNSQFNYHHLLNDTIHDALASQIIIKAISFIDEWNNYFGVKTETKDQESILQIKSLTKTAHSALIKSIDKDITNSFIHYNFTDTLLDTLRKNNANT